MTNNPKSRPSFSPRRRWKIGFDVFLRSIFVVAVLVMVNYLSSFFFHRFYLSPQTRVELSSRTLNLLHSLTNQISVTVYYDKTEELYPTVIALLNEYRSANPAISIKVVDYMRDAGEAEKVKEHYKLSSATDKDLVIFDCNGRVKIANGDSLAEYRLEQISGEKDREFRKKPVAFRGEMMFTSMLLAVVNPKPLKAYFLQGEDEPSLSESGERGYLKFGAVLGENYIAAVPLQLFGDDPIPDDCNLLIIAAGSQTTFSENELQKIDQYLSQGGRLFALFNYFTVKNPTGLEPILARWGVNVVADTVLEPKNTTSSQDVLVYQFSRHPAVNPLTQRAIQLILPRPVEAIDWKNPPANAPRVDELVFSSSASTLASLPANPPQVYPLMVAVEQKPVAGAANARGTTRILVVGDSFFLGNRQIGSGANRDFAQYAVNWLLDRTTLLAGIGPQPVNEFRLTMTRQQLQNVRWILLAALPGAILLLGGMVWFVRRK